MVRTLILVGTALLVLAMLGIIVADTEMGGARPHVLKSMLGAGAGLAGLGVLLGALGKLGRFRFGGRCPACHRTVRRGHIYCEDHFRDVVNRARDTLALR